MERMETVRLRGEGGACRDGYPEEVWADYALGNSEAGSRDALTGHLAICPACRASCDEWRRLFRTPANTENYAAIGAECDLYPSEKSRRALVKAVKRARIRKSLRSLKHPRYWGTALAAVILLLTVAGLLENAGSPDPIRAYVSRNEPSAVAVLQAPDTSKYRIRLAAGEAGDGYLWLSGDAGEALLLLDGLPSLESADYQAWANLGDRRESLGLLTVSGSKAHLHVKTPILRSTDNISLSAEPKGGSLWPTSDETLLVLLPNR
ncbi:MAG TPA: anti-sigma factor [Paenibacillus sp.]|uniref:anti-sigma factor n=1 Tax=Paenibacillus sp. TaxID=58172 RepID=UPI0028D0261C|nr:anti-sigma factor [Paenibacillus sp.]HUC90826.1 anti-sigma factor [Paenibacillus sp.]